MPEFKRGVRYWLVPLLASVATIGVAVEFMLLIPLLNDNAERAAQGRAARVVQCRFRSMTIREQDWFRDAGVISGRERDLLVAALPSERDCATVLSGK